MLQQPSQDFSWLALGLFGWGSHVRVRVDRDRDFASGYLIVSFMLSTARPSIMTVQTPSLLLYINGLVTFVS